jgi:hypothetical protein
MLKRTCKLRISYGYIDEIIICYSLRYILACTSDKTICLGKLMVYMCALNYFIYILHRSRTAVAPLERLKILLQVNLLC